MIPRLAVVPFWRVLLTRFPTQMYFFRCHSGRWGRSFVLMVVYSVDNFPFSNRETAKKSFNCSSRCLHLGGNGKVVRTRPFWHVGSGETRSGSFFFKLFENSYVKFTRRASWRFRLKFLIDAESVCDGSIVTSGGSRTCQSRSAFSLLADAEKLNAYIGCFSYTDMVLEK